MHSCFLDANDHALLANTASLVKTGVAVLLMPLFDVIVLTNSLTPLSTLKHSYKTESLKAHAMGCRFVKLAAFCSVKAYENPNPS